MNELLNLFILIKELDITHVLVHVGLVLRIIHTLTGVAAGDLIVILIGLLDVASLKVFQHLRRIFHLSTCLLLCQSVLVIKLDL